ncbi:hypothetical protein [Massilia sp. DD77]|uniref:hypothetical protein n=1 Tax=Massilia sp. DD77 TaxID=3109349 RepID=UPI002FFDDE20
MKKPRNKKYRPRPVSNGGGLTVIAKCHARGQDAAPLNDGQLQDLGLAYWLSLEQLRTGDASEEAWSCVVTALNIGLAMAESDIGAEHEDAFARALDGAFRAKTRSAKSGNFRLDGEALRDIEAALTVHDSQMEVATRAEVVAAMNLVRQRVDDGHVYKEAA